MKKRICAAVTAMGFIWLLGIAGASDCETMTFPMIVAQGTIALSAIIISRIIGGRD